MRQSGLCKIVQKPFSFSGVHSRLSPANETRYHAPSVP